MRPPNVTVIIPTYRRPERLKEAIQSVLEQTYPHFKLCVYDNGSGDDTEAVVRSFIEKDPRVFYHCHAENIGMVPNFNFGMERVSTPFFAFLSDDDRLLPDFLHTALNGLEPFPEAICWAGRMELQGAGPVKLLPQVDFEGLLQPSESFFLIRKRKHPLFNAILFRKEVVAELGVLDTRVGMMTDLDYEYRIALRFPFVFSKQSIGVFIRHETAAGESTGLKYIWPGWLRMVENIKQDEKVPIEIRQKVTAILMHDLKEEIFIKGIMALLTENFTDAEQAAIVLSDDLKSPLRSTVLRSLIFFCKRSTLSIKFLNFLYRARKKVRSLK